eukprot:12963645-Ditylum_brightwellii.AAC.1
MTGRVVLEEKQTVNKSDHKELKWIKQAVAEKSMKSFGRIYDECRMVRLKLRLGLPIADKDETKKEGSASANGRNESKIIPTSNQIVDGWIRWLRASHADYHRANRALAEVSDDLFEHDEASIKKSATEINNWSGGYEGAIPLLESWLVHFRRRLHSERTLYEINQVVDPAEKEKDRGVPGEEDPSCVSNSFSSSKVDRGRGGSTQFVKEWEAQIRVAAPHYILRTSFTKEIISRVVKGLHTQNRRGNTVQENDTLTIAFARKVMTEAIR